jgi:hypothetical protein
MPEAPSRNDDRTIACPACGHGFHPCGRRRFCSDSCRQAAWRARQPVTPVIPLPPRSPRPATIYECPSCETRYLGESAAQTAAPSAAGSALVVPARTATSRSR